MYDLTLRRQVLQCFGALTDRFDQNPSSLDEVAHCGRPRGLLGSAAYQRARRRPLELHDVEIGAQVPLALIARVIAEFGHPIANREFLVNVFPSLGENRREALKIAAGFRGEEAFDAGVAEEQALDTVLPHLSRDRCVKLATECVELYLWDRLGSDN